MNKDNSAKLFEDFPELYKGRHLSMQENLMCFGFECDDGWYDLIYNLSREIMEHCKNTNDKIPLIVQVKEKFGSLRFYIDFGSEAIYDIIDRYEAESSHICEITGAPGYLCSNNGWLKTLCSEEAEKRGYSRLPHFDIEN